MNELMGIAYYCDTINELRTLHDRDHYRFELRDSDIICIIDCPKCKKTHIKKVGKE